MKRRSFLKLLGITAVGVAAPKVLVGRAPLTFPDRPLFPRLNAPVSECNGVMLTPEHFDRTIQVFASPVLVHNYRQLGYNLADCQSLFVEEIPQDFVDRFFSELPTSVNTDRRRIGRAIRKARREASI